MKLCNYLENLLFPVLGIISKVINWLRRHSDFIVALATLITSVVACHLYVDDLAKKLLVIIAFIFIL